MPAGEVKRFLPGLDPAAAVWEPAPGCYFVARSDTAEPYVKPAQAGRHGHWPTRYRAAFALWGAGIERGRGGELDMLELAARFAAILELKAPRLGPRP